MSNVPSNVGKGSSMRKTQEELRQAGCPAMPLSEIQNFIKGGDRMLTREEVQDCILGYINRKLQTVIDEDSGEPVTIWRSAPMKGELAVALGIDETTLCRYVSGKYNGREYINGGTRGRISPSDFDLVRKAYQIITIFYESKLSENRNPAGIIYWLNNALNEKWSNEQTFKIEAEENNSNMPQATREEIRARFQALSEFREKPEFPEEID